MAPKLPDRYDTHVRLGRDEDVEEWLATDTSLDRPVLVRFLGPDADPERRGQFLSAVRSAAAVNHDHLASVYAVGSDDGGAYAVLEWTGGVSFADRLRARETIPVDEFLPNAAGLAAGLATLHAGGAVHGAVDGEAIDFSAAHPAKLSRFGRVPRTSDRSSDTVALAEALRVSLTGTVSTTVRPSQVAEGLPAAVDEALHAAEHGRMDAAALAGALKAAPYVPPPSTPSPWSWGWIIPAGALLLAALLIAAAGLAIDVDPDSPFLFPATPQIPTTSTTAAPAPPTTAVPTPPATDSVLLAAIPAVYDPLGDGTERDSFLAAVADDDTATTWRTERYFNPLPRIKDGVGITFDVAGTPSIVELTASPGTEFVLGWAEALQADPGEWERIGSSSVLAGTVRLQLPLRNGGTWLLWFTSLPEQADGEFYTVVSEVRFFS
jgi:hypothetical protein